MFTAKLAVFDRQSWSGDDAMLMLVRRTSLCTPELRNSQFINAIGCGNVSSNVRIQRQGNSANCVNTLGPKLGIKSFSLGREAVEEMLRC